MSRRSKSRLTSMTPEQIIDHLFSMMDVVGDNFFKTETNARAYKKFDTKRYQITIVVDEKTDGREQDETR